MKLPKIIICLACRPRFVANQVVAEYILKGANVNVDNIEYLAPEDRIGLKALQRIQQGETVNIDSLPIDEFDKQFLKEYQKQNPPRNNNPTSNYLTKCKNCGQSYEVATNPPRCWYCQSRNIETFKNGILQDLPADSNTTNNPTNKQDKSVFNSSVFWIVVAVIMVIISFFCSVWIQKKEKEYKKAGKKIPWWW